MRFDRLIVISVIKKRKGNGISFYLIPSENSSTKQDWTFVSWPESPERSLCRYDRLLTIIICFVSLCVYSGELCKESLHPEENAWNDNFPIISKCGKENRSLVHIIIEFRIFVEASERRIQFQPGQVSVCVQAELVSYITKVISVSRFIFHNKQNEKYGNFERIESWHRRQPNFVENCNSQSSGKFLIYCWNSFYFTSSLYMYIVFLWNKKRWNDGYVMRNFFVL